MTDNLPPLSRLELECYVSPKRAGKMRSCSEDTIRRDPELSRRIVKISPRRDGIKVKYVLDLADA